MKNIKEKYPLLFKDKTKEINERYESAWENAKLIAEVLKEKYNAKSVTVFGSLTKKSRFHNRSDIDLAVEGIADEKFYKAYGEITGKFTEIDIDLVDVKDCKKSILNVIKKEGIEI